MPVDQSVLGFANQWYEEGYKESINYRLDENHTVRIFSTPYFIASKLEAFKDRGNGDRRTSHDFEDLVFVWNNRSTLWEELDQAPTSVKKYLQREVNSLLEDPYFEECITAHLDSYEEIRAKYILEELRNFSTNTSL